MAKFNKVRTEKMREKSADELQRFIDAKTLSSAAAEHELKRRTPKS